MSINREFEIETPWRVLENLKAGDSCPACRSAKIDYDGLLNLCCEQCNYTLAGCFT
jgi:ribosomal protein L37AE/L43A